MNARKPKILVILGPTSTGKSDLSVQLALALEHEGEIISADSRQVYTGLDIGTGKITKKEMRGVPHHLLDIVSPKKVFSVGEWQKLAQKKIVEIILRGKTPIICGGTGFYIQSIVDNLVLPEVAPNIALRKELERKSVAELFMQLQQLDPERSQTIEKENPVRLIRAIEIAIALGKVPHLDRNASKQRNTYDILQIGLTLPMNELQLRIHDRLVARMKKGMVTEAIQLHENGLSWKRMYTLGLEYRYLAQFLQKNAKTPTEQKIARAELLAHIEKGNLDYAKRQMTWFKRDPDIHWFRPEEYTKIEKVVWEFLVDK